MELNPPLITGGVAGSGYGKGITAAARTWEAVFSVFFRKDNEHGDHQTRRLQVRKGTCELTGTKCEHKEKAEI